MEVGSVTEFLQWVDKNPDSKMFRGQLNFDWKLIPSVVRYSHHVAHGYEAMSHIEEHLIQKFEKFSVPYMDIRPKSYIEKLIHAQHFGLPTRLLDWSTNPLKALYFAVDDPSKDDLDGVVFALKPRYWWEQIAKVQLDDKLAAFYPENINERLVSQEGCFLSFPLPDAGFKVSDLTCSSYDKQVKFLSSVKISASKKQNIRLQLCKLGVNQRVIYPGLEGIALWVKSSLSKHAV
ncbi:FRG domain-containing protein [Shewanella frigidimarina]|uniref:FRG domain-containing protein n=1 Tax=Shewanella frigidimarina TaxID=56812 RepID=UPI003D7B2509